MQYNISHEDWAAEEAKTANLKDHRLNNRYADTLQTLSRKPQQSIPVASEDRHKTKTIYRFFDNEAVTLESVLQPHKDATMERMKDEPVALFVQDTTELDYTSKPAIEGLGKLSYEKQLGMYLHPTVVLTPGRICLGIADAQVLIRKSLGKSKNRQREPIEKKESKRWLDGYRIAQNASQQLPNTQVVSIADRECDIYEIFAEAEEARGNSKTDWIIRGSKDRCLIEQDAEARHKKLFKEVNQSSVLGAVTFDLSRAPGRKARRVTQEIRATTVTLKPPYRMDKKLPKVRINVVTATEIRAPEGVKPISWLLLTSLPISTDNEALHVIQWYLCRWQIEIFFRILKTGCKVENLGLQTVKRLKACLAMYMIIAWRILLMTMLGRQGADIMCDAVFSADEWRAAYIMKYKRPPPSAVPTLNQIIRIVAEVGGFMGRKGDGEPGPKSIWLGLQQLQFFIIGIEMASAHQEVYNYWSKYAKSR
jgi:hypothetical protein